MRIVERSQGLKAASLQGATAIGLFGHVPSTAPAATLVISEVRAGCRHRRGHQLLLVSATVA